VRPSSTGRPGAYAAALQARGIGIFFVLFSAARGPSDRRTDDALELVTAIQATWLAGATLMVLLQLPLRMGSIDESSAQTAALRIDRAARLSDLLLSTRARDSSSPSRPSTTTIRLENLVGGGRPRSRRRRVDP